MRIPVAAAALAAFTALAAAVPPAAAQTGGPLAQPAGFESWGPALAEPAVPRRSDAGLETATVQSRSVRNGLIGGLIGAAAGFVVCTAIATIADDAAVSRIATCTASGYALFMGGGFGVGFLIGASVD